MSYFAPADTTDAPEPIRALVAAEAAWEAVKWDESIPIVDRVVSEEYKAYVAAATRCFAWLHLQPDKKVQVGDIIYRWSARGIERDKIPPDAEDDIPQFIKDRMQCPTTSEATS